MAKKKRGNRRMRADSMSDDENASVHSADTANRSDDAELYDSYSRAQINETALEEAMENLAEKRTDIRVEALETLMKYVEGYISPEEVEDSFVTNLLYCLRRPSKEEAVYGARMLAVVGLIFGSEEERFYQRCKSVLEPLVRAAREPEMKTESIRALAMLCFVCSVEEENIDEFLAFLDKYLECNIDGSICTAACEAWGLIASALSDEDLFSEEYIDRYLPKFEVLLNHKDVEARSAAAENIALLHESVSALGAELPFDGDIIDKVLSMSKETSKKTSKKDRKVQKSVFREVHATLDKDESPHVSLLLRNENLELDGWRAMKQYDALRKTLRTGFQEHLKFNPIVRILLDMGEVVDEPGMDRRQVFDKKSYGHKQKTNERKLDRRRKHELQDAYLDD